MNNEYKEWMKDRAVEILWNDNVIDKIEEIIYSKDKCYVHGWYHKEKVVFSVWLDNEEWKYERR